MGFVFLVTVIISVCFAVPVSIFVYGTLQVPEVMQAVTGSVFESCPALLKNYQRYKIKNRTFPGIIKQPGSSVDGVLYRNIDDYALQLLDQFEDVFYERVKEDLLVNESIEPAFVYVIADKYREYLSDEEWNLEEFKSKYLQQYLNLLIN